MPRKIHATEANGSKHVAKKRVKLEIGKIALYHCGLSKDKFGQMLFD